MPTYTTASNGTAKVTLTVPADAGVGSHDINTRGPNGDSLMTRTFVVTDPTGNAPAQADPPAADPTPAPTPAPTPSCRHDPTPTADPPAGRPACGRLRRRRPHPLRHPFRHPFRHLCRHPLPATGVTYAAVFGGDATGATDVTDALATFLQSHNGQRVALAVNGVYKVTHVAFTASNLTVDFRGARLQGSQAGVYGILFMMSSSNIVLNDPTSTEPATSGEHSTEWEHGIHVDGGSNITINNPTTRNTRGDGIYVGYQSGKNLPATGVVINNPNIEHASRNGISPVGGEVTIRGGHIAYTGLFGIDFESNDATEANSIHGIVDGVDIRHHGDLPAASSSCTCYAVAAAGHYTDATKPSMVVQNLTGDALNMVISNTSSVTIRNNVSDTTVSATLVNVGSVTFTGNTRITRQ